MSFFYLTPVKGDLPIHVLETIIRNRLNFLKTGISGGKCDSYNEYVVEGSVYDNVGHFMFCIIAIMNESTSFSKFFIKAETELFKKRVELLSAYDIRNFAKKLLKSTKKFEGAGPSYINALQSLCQHLMLKDLAQHICAMQHHYFCSVHNIQLHFKYCLTFVAKRQVELKNGLAYIPCGKWKQYLVTLFNENLKNRLKKSKIEPRRSDCRITELVTKISHDLLEFTNLKYNSKLLKSSNVDVLSKYFPPCMLNLHKTLRRKHRLSHTQRFYYSLFLKDIGMPLEESIDFWRSEYKQSPNGSHSCCHNWEKDEKKYLYGIRHMYGLEGARKNYSSVNCTRIQSVESSCSEGGCPFKTFDNNKMVQLLHTINIGPSLLSKIHELKQKQHYTSACMLLLNKKLPSDCDIDLRFTPVNYFMMAST